MMDSQAFLKTLTSRPGVYLMLNKDEQIIYVGKAKNLKKRVASYFKALPKDTKTALLMRHVHAIKTIVTQTENEALILECQLIKQHHPRYNISLRDDKSYPYIFISDHEYPRITIHRGAQKIEGQYYGPFSNATAVHETIYLLRKLFLLRSCKDTFFSSRSRPCLQYQIHRCTAPCVNFISKKDYARNVEYAALFLEGKSDTVIQILTEQMNHAVEKFHYEVAAEYRDLIQMLREIQSKQCVAGKDGSVDVIAVTKRHGTVCISILSIRHGKILGHKAFLPKLLGDMQEDVILSEFLGQYYLNDAQDIPRLIILSHAVDDIALLQQVFTEQVTHTVKIQVRVKGEKAEWKKMAMINAQETLRSRLLSQAYLYERFIDLQKKLKLANLPERIECFDISHTHGELTVASCVVFGVEGPIKKEYRQFNITEITPGDDFAAMHQALKRHFKKLVKEGRLFPDILIIDGGKGQMKQAEDVLSALSLNHVMIVGVAKGVTRKPGLETIYLSSRSEPLEIDIYSPAFHLMQQIRDEAHRFAITSHRKKRAKKRIHSVLEDIPGIGEKRRSDVLKHFGGMQGVTKASIKDLEAVRGINKDLAKLIYEHLHQQE